MNSISQRNIEKRRAITTLTPLYEKSACLLRNVEAQHIEFKSSWTKWIFLNKEEYSKTEESYKKAVENIKEALHLSHKTINKDDPEAFEDLENVKIDVECCIESKIPSETRSGFIARVFEVLPVITMTILPSLVQAGFISLNVFIIASSAAIGAISFLIKSRNIIEITIDNIKKEDALFLNHVYRELVYSLGIFSKIYIKNIKYKNEDCLYKKMHSETSVFLLNASSDKKQNYFYSRTNSKNKNPKIKNPAALLRTRATKNRISVSYQKNSFQAYA